MTEPMRHNLYLSLAVIVATALVACGGLTAGEQKASTVPGGTYRGVGTGAGLESLTASRNASRRGTPA